jgi:hypothetical protein
MTMRPEIKAEIGQYVSLQVPPNSFVRAVLENDLRAALAQAAGEKHPPTLEELQAVVRYCHWEISGSCWGSKEKVAAWLAAEPSKIAASK